MQMELVISYISELAMNLLLILSYCILIFVVIFFLIDRTSLLYLFLITSLKKKDTEIGRSNKKCLLTQIRNFILFTTNLMIF